MSAPSELQQSAQILKFGFLADRTRYTLEKSISGVDLDEGDLEVLTKASAFLRDISDGAEIVKSGVAHGANINRSLVAFDYALNLLKSLPSIAETDTALASYFSQLSSTIESVEGRQDKESVERAVKFFDGLSGILAPKIYRSELTAFQLRA